MSQQVGEGAKRRTRREPCFVKRWPLWIASSPHIGTKWAWKGWSNSPPCPMGAPPLPDDKELGRSEMLPVSGQVLLIRAEGPR